MPGLVSMRTKRLERIVAVAHPDNRASRRVMEKPGMSCEPDAQYKGIRVLLYAIRRLGTPYVFWHIAFPEPPW